MLLFHNIKGDAELQKANGNYNTRESLERATHAFNGRSIISFDGIYKSVYENRDLLKGREFCTILFVMGNYIGGDNTFDKGQPYEEYCTMDELLDLKENYNCTLAWHSKTHRSFLQLTDKEIEDELDCPEIFKTSFAYPYGEVDARSAYLVKKAGFNFAYSVNQGDGSRYQMNRYYWEH